MVRDQFYLNQMIRLLQEGQEKRRKLEPPWYDGLERDTIDMGYAAIHLQDEVNRVLAQAISLLMSTEARFPLIAVRERDGKTRVDSTLGSYSELIARDESFQVSVHNLAKQLCEMAQEQQKEADKVAARFGELYRINRDFDSF